MGNVLPPPSVKPLDRSERLSEVWYDYFQQNDVILNGTVAGGTSLATQVATINGEITTINGQIAALQAVVPPWTVVAKTSDETRSATVTFANDSTLTFAVVAGTKYRFRFNVFYLTPVTADFKWQLTGPAAVTAIHYVGWDALDGDTGASRGRAAFSVSISETSGSATSGSMIITGILQNGVNAGNVTLQWAQNTSDPGNTTVQAGSFIEYATV